jgi:hypothetical protein
MDNYSMPQPTPGEEYVDIALFYGKKADFWPQVSEFMLGPRDRSELDEQLRAYVGQVGFSRSQLIEVSVKVDHCDGSEIPIIDQKYYGDQSSGT